MRALLADTGWADRRRLSAAALIALATFGILAFELALIRWTSSQVRVFAYFNNLVLMGAFLGMGLGVAMGRRLPGLVHLALPMMLVVSVPLAFSEELGLVHLTFPDRTIALWGGGHLRADFAIFSRNIGVFIALFTAIVGVFVCCGAPLGYLFARLPVLRAYSADLWGSLLGVLAFAIASWQSAGPEIWLALGVVPLVWIARRWLAVACGVAVIALGFYSGRGAQFSAYNRIDLEQTPLWLEMQVNRDFHQYLHDFSDRRFSDPALPANLKQGLLEIRDLYDLPFSVNATRGSALVVGAGTGNDVQAAIRNGYREVTSVDIDADIIGIGKKSHPEQPYMHPGVRTVVDDARSFFGKDVATYDVVCFGLLDSHAMSSAMSTLRLDNYVYTEEGIRAAWDRVRSGGHLSLAISCTHGRWFFERLYWTIAKATGQEPVALWSPLHGSTATFLVARGGVELSPAVVGQRTSLRPMMAMDDVLTPNDDWPFLYIRPGAFPWGYVTVLGFVLALAAFTVPRAFAMRAEKGAFDAPLFLMGAGFLLIETRGITSMSLLFGSTWVVNAAIFGGILVMVLVGNRAVQRWAWTNPVPWFIALFAAVALLYVFPIGWLQTLPLLGRAAIAGLITGLPIGIAGVIVPMQLKRAAQPAAALGSNLLGAVLGGCLEYYSMLGGLKSTALMALVLYLLAFMLVQRRRTAKEGHVGAAVPVGAAV